MAWFSKIFGIGGMKCISWKPAENDIMVYHFPDENLTAYSQLIVNETQEALLFKDGEMIQRYAPGRHTLDTRNLPMAQELNSAPFGKNPFMAEIWFVNKIDFKMIRFETNMFRYHDPDYGSMIPLACIGGYGIKIVDSAKFIKKLLGTSEIFTVQNLTSSMQGELSTNVASLVSNYMQRNNIGIKAISSYLAQLSQWTINELSGVFSGYGLQLISFHINSLDIDERRTDGKEILEAITAQSSQAIAGYSWQQKQAFKLADRQLDVAGNALASDSELGSIGAMMMMAGGRGMFGGNNMGVPMNSPAAAPMQQQVSGAAGGGGVVGGMVFCSKCAKKYSSKSKFCPFCGDVYSPCPKCGSDNSADAVLCVNCGAPLQDSSGGVCPECNHPLVAGSVFCPGCGKSVERVCSRCKTTVKPNEMFCPACGKKME